MSYQALLFCPDEKTARVVSQVLSELEFNVEPCHEPFAAVKKLMVQHFDALVVDCDNEQNAALLFKSARNSGSNQASLAVAVVEGQAGVAKAFRLGANLVLTKPIHVEQSKGTLRVARGLLRKGQAAKPAAGAPSAAPPTMFTQPAAAAPFPPPQKIAAPPAMSAAAFELDAEPMPAPDPADAALLEYMPDSPASNVDNSARPAAESDPSKQYPWQPRKPLAEPMASALRKAAEAAGKSEFDAAAPHVTGTPQASATSSGNPQTGSAQSGFALGKAGAAAAPARAREIPAPDAKKLGLEPTASAITVPTTDEVKRIEDPSAGDGWDSPSSVTVTEAPSFGSLDDNQASDAGGSKKTLLIAVVLLGLAAAGYFGWTKMQSAHPQPAPQSVAPAMPALPPQPAASVPESQPAAGDVVSPQGETDLSGTTAVPASSKPSAAVVAEGPGLKASTAAKATPAEDEITIIKAPATEKTEAAPVLKVKNGSSTQAKPEPEAQEPVQAPAVTSIASGSGSSVLSGIVNTNAINAEKAPQQKLRISQGVSQGLIIKKVQPVYPPQARQMHLEGTVELQANVAESGSIASVKQLSGDRVLGRAAMDAVRQWKYKPYYLNGQPVEVETQITVNFKLP
ncbi:MAG TPA: TonB family protein [Terriglobales bacterium]|nr:TonB family protein [Terriglobales bacterium]